MLVYMDQKKNLKGTPVRKDSNRAYERRKAGGGLQSKVRESSVEEKNWIYSKFKLWANHEPGKTGFCFGPPKMSCNFKDSLDCITGLST